jgi:integrase
LLPDGDYLKPDTLTAKVCLLTAKAGMQGIGLHSLRHSYGSHLLSEGIPLAAVRKLLGHSTVFTTANVYAHALSKDEVAAAGVWDEIAKKAKLS